jgi:V/A-type H+-transporting ATPase subunit D
MAKLALNKSSLAHQQQQLKTFKRFLPSLDLKRRQLIGERAKAQRAIAKTREKLEHMASVVGEKLPMLANTYVDLTNIVQITGVVVNEENVMGTRLPKLAKVEVAVAHYGYMAKPHWVDKLVDYLQVVLELRVRVQVEERRLALLEDAVRTITQRVNLFDKVLIPRTQQNIKRIQINLSDAERTAVGRAKIAKRKHAAMVEPMA